MGKSIAKTPLVKEALHQRIEARYNPVEVDSLDSDPMR